MKKMKKTNLPIFITEDYDLGIYASIEDAKIYLESIDVANGIYIGYDSLGNLLSLSVSDNEKLNDDDKIIITLSKPLKNCEKKLEKIIRDFLDYMNNPVGKDLNYSLADLTQYCLKFACDNKPVGILSLTAELLRDLFKKLFKYNKKINKK